MLPIVGVISGRCFVTTTMPSVVNTTRKLRLGTQNLDRVRSSQKLSISASRWTNILCQRPLHGLSYHVLTPYGDASTNKCFGVSPSSFRLQSSVAWYRHLTSRHQQDYQQATNQSKHRREHRRMFARSSQSESDNNDPIVKARNFLLRLNYSPEIANGVIDALKQSGINGTGLLSMVRSLAGRWEVGEDNGLEDLVDSVKLQLVRSEGRKPITLYVIPSNAWRSSEEDAPDFSAIEETKEEFDQALKRAFKVEAQTGLTLTDIAKFGDGEGASELGEMIECACAGIMACSTCHVVIDPQYFELVGEPSDAEQDMLDLAYAPRSTSRLGCQIQLEESLDGMIIRLPRGTNNLMDDIPFEG